MFLECPRCSNETTLARHLETWPELPTKYGNELKQTPETLRILMLGVLLETLEDKLNNPSKRSNYPSYQSVVQYCRKRYEIQRQIAISEARQGKKRYVN